jgi:serine/threonine protein kinase
LIAVRTFEIDLDDQGALESFRGELQRFLRLSHPCLVRIVGYSLPTSECPAQIGTEFAQHGSLGKALEERRSGSVPSFLDDTGIAIIISGIVLGMQFIHSQGVVHRALKPSNILIDGRGWPRIGDVWTSRLIELCGSQTVGLATLLYMAPETYEDCGYTAAADVFSFALILYELLADDYVFSPTLSEPSLIKRVLDPRRPGLPGSMNPVLQDIITHCWAADPKERYAFDEIWDRLQGIRCQVTENVDTQRVAEFVGSVRSNQGQ